MIKPLPVIRMESQVAQSGLSLCDPMDCSLSGSCVHGIFQARVLARIAISFSWDLPDPIRVGFPLYPHSLTPSCLLQPPIKFLPIL